MNSLTTHLPALQVIVPLFGAFFTALLRRGTLAWALALLVSWLVPAISIALLLQVLSSGPISYHLGGWAPPWGIEYRIDLLNAFGACIDQNCYTVQGDAGMPPCDPMSSDPTSTPSCNDCYNTILGAGGVCRDEQQACVDDHP